MIHKDELSSLSKFQAGGYFVSSLYLNVDGKRFKKKDYEIKLKALIKDRKQEVDGLGLNRICGPQGRSQKGNEAAGFRISLPQQHGCSVEIQNGQEKQKRRGQMDGNIHHVIAGNIVLADIPVQGNRKIGNRPKNFTGSHRAGIKRTQDGFRGQSFDVKPSISNDVGFIV